MRQLIWHSWRSWRNAKGLAVLAILALAVGIGSASAIFTVVDAVLLKPLPYRDSNRWVALFGGSTLNDKFGSLSYADVSAFQQRTRSFDVFGWYQIFGDYNLTSPGAPQHIQGSALTPSLIDNLGVHPIYGRLFTGSDGLDVALLSHRIWASLGSDPTIVGKSITLSAHAYTVVGVMPSWFRFPIVSVANQPANDVWVPVPTPHDEAQKQNYAIFGIYGRLKSGVSVSEARADARRAASSIAKDRPANHQSFTAVLFGLQDFVVKEIRPMLLLLFGAAGLLLLITCGNVAGLLLTRSVGRARETAIRIALGGGRKELALQFLFEGLLVSLAAAALGIAASFALVKIIISLAAEYIPRADEVSTNWAVVLFAVAMACLAATLSALAPLWQAMRTHPSEALTDGARASSGARSRKLSRLLVISEIALAFTLLSVGALLVSQLQKLTRTDPGFEADNLLTFQLNVVAHFSKESDWPAYQNRLIQEFAAIPGVTSVALANQVPLDGCCLGSSLFVPGQSDRPDIDRSVSLVTASTGYFKTMHIPLRRGRLLNAQDTDEHLVRILIDEAAAKRFWPHSDPVGAVGQLGTADGSHVQVVGVVADVKNEGLGQAPRPEVYFLSTLSPPNPMQFFVRSNLPAATLVPAIRRTLRSIDPAQPISALQSMQQVVANSLTYQRLSSMIIGFFALAALLLASLGVFGVTAYSVRQRRVEIGTRMALGANSRDLLRLIVGGGVNMAVYGLAIGATAVVLCSLLVIRYFNIHDIGPLPYLSSIAIIAAVAMLASFFPAWQATLLSPMLAIRDQSDSLWSVTRRSVEQVLGITPAADRAPAFDSASLTDFMEASRRADSFAEVLRLALTTACEKVQAQSVIVLQRAVPDDFRVVARVPEVHAPDITIPANGFLLNRLQSYGSPLAFSSDDLDASHRWASEQKPQFLAEIETLQQTGTRLAIALRMKDEILGILLVGAPVSRNAYSSGEKKLLRAYAEQFALLAENARLTDRVVEQEKFRRDVALAAEVQQRLLPQSSPQTAASSLGAFTLPVRSVGGDYYDFLDVGKHRIGIALADVAGKGIAAALIMAVIHASLRIIASEKNISLPDVAARMNSFLHRSTGASSYATFFYAQVDEERRQLRYVNAGHNPPYLVRTLEAQSPIEELATGGIIIGMFPMASYEEATVDLRAGDVLLIFTDGVTEALNTNEEEFSEERLKTLLRSVAHLPVEEIKSAISKELHSWIGEAPQHDDLTFVVLKVN